ncbi:hypothetical protein H0H81_008713 [Sphagnurus paluster]|uniref:DNA repair metallo-beta-lactamase domain-containing protein n=1 Tax=Sphagnurus paluster TaxID=117069 RepID=A0A9P7FW83_9AGAR|nr:hypothetical protein H0H81_008713 [Sphagnurus paluster]
MPSTKRKLQSTVTLHDFFTPGSDSSQRLKGKHKATPNRSKPKQNAPSQPRDVIIIDSDSEPEVVRVTKAKRTRGISISSGEVEFVDSNAIDGNATACPPSPHPKEILKSQGKIATSHTVRKHRHTSLNSDIDSAPLKRDKTVLYTFGAPTLLLNNSASTPPNVTSNSSPLSFGAPTLLVGPNNVSILSNQGASSSHIPVSPEPIETDLSTKEERVETDLLPDTSHNWGRGDDETALARALQDDVEIEETLDTSSTSPPGESEYFEEAIEKSPPSAPAQASRELQPLSALSPQKLDEKLTDCDTKRQPSRTLNSNAFSILMSSNRENEAWKEASIAEDRRFRSNKNNGGRRKAPFYKVLRGMPIAVDAFCYGTIPGVNAYFLTHAHSDHYTNLAANWKSGPIYCSQGTANLIIHMLSVGREWVHPLPMNVPTEIPNTGGVYVTLIDANHCPGSSLFYFEGRQTANAGDDSFKSEFVGSARVFRYLHCGDFRASPRHVLHPAVKGKKIDHVYLDTTYLDPRYIYPPQPLVVAACAELARKLVAGESIIGNNGTIDGWRIPANANSREKETKADKMLIIVGTYSVGKERIVKAIAHALKTKVYCDARKVAILRCQSDAELDAMLTSNPSEAGVHVVPLGIITSDRLEDYVRRYKGTFTKAAAFRPTGWTFTPPTGTDQIPSVSSIITRPHRPFTYTSLRPARNSTSTLQVFPVPYSEHSSFYELTCFALSLDWSKMIATVNIGSEKSRGKMERWFSRWEAEKKKRGEKIVPHSHTEYW